MKTQGLNTEIKAGGKKFHVQTNYLEPVEKIISSIYEDGQILFKKERHVDEDNVEKALENGIKELHKETIDDIELLYYISVKVSSIRHAPSNLRLGKMFLHYNLIQDGIEEFKNAVNLDPDLVDAYKYLSISYLSQKNYEQALETVNAALEKEDAYPDLYCVLGRIQSERKEYSDSIVSLNKALELNPDYEEAGIYLIYTLLKSVADEYEDESLPGLENRKEIAISQLQRSEKFIRSDRLIEIYEILEKGDFNKTCNVLLSVIDEDLKKDIGYLENEFYLRFMFGGKGKNDEFVKKYVEDIQKTLAQNPQYADLRNNLGIAYLIQCRNLFLKALDEFREALNINEKYNKAERNLKLAENDGKGFLILLRALLK
ncbi:MAG: tetratricopeptide repeat protein [candidate division KSB1 bacterium]|jgi:tetratricopeptide (TPR) repeat protein|nr:tetratricopeptide repeat protein [candidate division KSB1 bacterium]